jgi:hypothetical protein
VISYEVSMSSVLVFVSVLFGYRSFAWQFLVGLSGLMRSFCSDYRSSYGGVRVVYSQF